MSLILRASLAANAQQARVMQEQFAVANNFRAGSVGDVELFLKMTGNAGRTPADAYREFDSTTKIEMVPAGEHATLTRLLQKPKSVHIGKSVYEYRKASSMSKGQTSLSGQVGVKLDAVDYGYGGTIIPVHDRGYGRTWREVEAMRSEAFDATVDDSREAERVLMSTMNDFLWSGNSELAIKGKSWLGFRADPSVASAVIGVDLAGSTVAADDIREEVARIRDILYITNNCTKPLRLGVSREIMSNWERPFSTSEGMFGTIAEMVKKLRGISDLYEDSELVGNQLVLYWDDQEGFHAVVGQGISSFAIQRVNPFDDFMFIKWCAAGFLAKMDASGHKTALYAAGA